MRLYAAANVFSSYQREREAEEEEYYDDEKKEEKEEEEQEEEEEEEEKEEEEKEEEEEEKEEEKEEKEEEEEGRECTCLHEAEADQFVTEACILSTVEGTWWNPKDTLQNKKIVTTA